MNRCWQMLLTAAVVSWASFGCGFPAFASGHRTRVDACQASAPAPPAAHQLRVPPTHDLLAAVDQNDNNERGNRINGRAMGKLIKIGILGVVLVCGGVGWLYNKLKPQ